MKKSQRLRFYALVTKQCQGNALSSSESADLKTLSALVATHPNAADDTDDDKKEETEEEKKEREKKEAEDKEAKGEETDEEKKKREDKEKEEAKAKAALKPGVSARLAAAMAGLTGGTPALAAAALQTEQTAHGKTKADLTAANTQISTLTADLAGVTADFAALCDFLGLKPAEISGKTQTDIDGICTAKINAAAIEQVASIGFPSGKLPTPSGEGKDPTKEELMAQFNALTDANERADFYAKHSAKIFG